LFLALSSSRTTLLQRRLRRNMITVEFCLHPFYFSTCRTCPNLPKSPHFSLPLPFTYNSVFAFRCFRLSFVCLRSFLFRFPRRLLLRPALAWPPLPLPFGRASPLSGSSASCAALPIFAASSAARVPLSKPAAPFDRFACRSDDLATWNHAGSR